MRRAMNRCKHIKMGETGATLRSLDEPFAGSVDHGLEAAVDSKFREEPRNVISCGEGPDAEGLGNLQGGRAGCQQAEHLYLPP